MSSDTKGIIDQAYSIAKKSIESDLLPIGIINGEHHYVDLWARDSFFASLGVNTLGKTEYSKSTIELFLKYQRWDGLVPYRILRSPTTWAKYRGRPTYFKTPHPNFRSRQSGGIVPDGGLMTILGVRSYFDTTRDLSFLKKIYPQLQQATDWYVHSFNSGLVREWFQCSWTDSLMQIGNVLYTNLLYYKALADMRYFSQQLHLTKDEEYFAILSQQIKDLVMAKFWNGHFLADWIDYKRQDYFASYSNLLAVLFDLFDRPKARQVIEYALANCWNQFTLETNYPKYPFWRVYPLNYLAGIPDYQNRGCLWLQSGILLTIALSRLGFHDRAVATLNEISQQIIKYGDVYEIYERDGRPVNRFFYKSENHFSWSSGLFLYAYSQIFKTGISGNSKSPDQTYSPF